MFHKMRVSVWRAVCRWLLRRGLVVVPLGRYQEIAGHVARAQWLLESSGSLNDGAVGKLGRHARRKLEPPVAAALDGLLAMAAQFPDSPSFRALDLPSLPASPA